jgi:hypothetical protein
LLGFEVQISNAKDCPEDPFPFEVAQDVSKQESKIKLYIDMDIIGNYLAFA